MEMQTDKMQDFFNEMYAAHEKVKRIKEKIDKLYQSAIYISPPISDMPRGQSNPKRLEDTIIEIADLKSFCEQLLRKRARFDRFTCDLTTMQEKILCMRCKLRLEWKEIANETGMSLSSVQRVFKYICGLAVEYDLF